MGSLFESPFLAGEWAGEADEPAREEEAARTVDDLTAMPMRWICRIHIAWRAEHPGGRTERMGLAGMGSGLLISPRHVLTAAHVMDKPDPAQEGVRYWREGAVVIPGAAASRSPNDGFEIARVDFHPRWRDGSGGAAADLALLTLAQPLGAREFKSLGGHALGCWGSTPGHLWLADLPPADAERAFAFDVCTAGYPHEGQGAMVAARGHLQAASAAVRRSFEQNGQVGAWLRAQAVLVADVNARKGQSGSPLWAELHGRRYLLGVVVQATPRANNVLALGPAARRIIDGWMNGGRQHEAEEPATAGAPEAEAAPEPEVTAEGTFEPEEFSDDELEHLGVFECDSPVAAKPPTIGFEFDLNHGFEKKVVDAMGLGPPVDWRWPSEGLQATDHQGRDGRGRLADGFVVTMDAVRLEVATEPVRLDDDAEFKQVVDGVVAFGRELQAAGKTPQKDSPVPGVGGVPLVFHHPRTVVNQPELDAHHRVAFPGDRKHAKYRREVVPLVIHRLFGRYPTSTALWAAPQATLTLPLAEFGKLVWEIHRTMGGAPGEALTGPAGARLGLRDDVAWEALKIAFAERKRRVGTTLADGTRITEAMFSRALTSTLTLLLMYLLTGVRSDPRDDEAFAKGYLPINVKTPLHAIHKEALTADEKRLLHELYTDTAARSTLWALVPRTPRGDGSTLLFPAGTSDNTKLFFTDAPTWDTLVDAFAGEKPLKVTRDNRIAKKGHRRGDEILIAPLSSKIDFDKTRPLIAVELRRLGFAPVGLAQWKGLMQRVCALARQVNPK